MAHPNAFSVVEVRERLRASTAHRAHEFRPDSECLLDAELIDPTRVHGPRHLTDVYLLALAVKRGGRLVTFDATIARKPSSARNRSTSSGCSRRPSSHPRHHALDAGKSTAAVGVDHFIKARHSVPASAPGMRPFVVSSSTSRRSTCPRPAFARCGSRRQQRRTAWSS
jgi:hypothetical protein